MDSSGNQVVVGSFTGTVDFGGGPLTSTGGYDIFMARYSPAGAYLWSKSLGSMGNDYAYGVALDGSGNMLVTGYVSGTTDFGGGPLTIGGSQDVFVAKYSPAGAYLWALAPTGSGWAAGAGLTADANGNVVVGGYFGGTLDFGCGALSSSGVSDAFVAKYSAAGACLWSRDIGGSGTNTRVMAVAVNGTGNVVVTGGFQGAADFGGAVLTSAGSYDVFVASYSATGTLQWAKRFGDTGYDYAYGLTVDGSGNVLVAGSFQGTVDFGGGPVASVGGFYGADIFMAKYTSAGAYVWAKDFGSGFSEVAYGIAADAGGNISLTGAIVGGVNFGTGYLFGSGNYDIFVARFTPNGTNLWAKRVGGLSDDRGKAVAAESTGNVLATGSFAQSADFGGGLMTTNGGANAFVVKLTP